MGRPSKLTPAQWGEVERRVLGGETARALGREFGVTEGAIRQRFGVNARVSTQATQVQETARKLAEAETALQALPITQRPVAMEMAEAYRNTMLSMGRAAELAAKNSHRLHHLANTELQKVDETKMDQSEGVLRGVAVLTKMANDAATTPINLLAASKDRIQKMEDQPDPNAPATSGVLVVPGLAASSEAWASVAKG